MHHSKHYINMLICKLFIIIAYIKNNYKMELFQIQSLAPNISNPVTWANFQDFQMSLNSTISTSIDTEYSTVSTKLDKILANHGSKDEITAIYNAAVTSFVSILNSALTNSSTLASFNQYIDIPSQYGSSVAQSTIVTNLAELFAEMAMNSVGISMLSPASTQPSSLPVCGDTLAINPGTSVLPSGLFEMQIRIPPYLEGKIFLAFTGLEPFPGTFSNITQTNAPVFLVKDTVNSNLLVQAWLVESGTSMSMVCNYSNGQQTTSLVPVNSSANYLDTNYLIPNDVLIPATSGSVFIPPVYSGRITVLVSNVTNPFQANFNDLGTPSIAFPTKLNNVAKYDFFEFAATPYYIAAQSPPPGVTVKEHNNSVQNGATGGSGFGYDISAVDQFQFCMGFSITGAPGSLSNSIRTGSGTSKYVNKGFVRQYLSTRTGQFPWSSCVNDPSILNGAIVAPANVFPVDIFNTSVSNGSLVAGSWKTSLCEYLCANRMPWIRFNGTWYPPTITQVVVAAGSDIITNVGAAIGDTVYVFSYMNSPIVAGGDSYIIPFNNYIALNGGTNVATGLNAWYGNITNKTFGASFAKFVACMIESNNVPPQPTSNDLSVLNAMINTTSIASGISAPSDAQLALLNDYGLSAAYFANNVANCFQPYPTGDPRKSFEFIDEYSKALLSFGNRFYTYTYGDQLGLANFVFYGVDSTSSSTNNIVNTPARAIGGGVIEIFSTNELEVYIVDTASTANPAPAINSTATELTVSTVALTESTNPSYVYSWSVLSPTDTSNVKVISTTPTLHITSAYNGTVNVEITDTTTGNVATSFIYVNIPEDFNVVVQNSNNVIVANDATITTITTLTATASSGTGPYTYAWNGVSGNTSYQVKTTDSLVSLVVTDSLGATIEWRAIVNFPEVTLEVSNGTAYLANNSMLTEAVSLVATVLTGTAPYTYAWTYENNTEDSDNFAVINPTSGSTVSLVVTDANGKSASWTATFDITFLPPTFNVVSGTSLVVPDSTISAPTTLTIDVTSGAPPYSYLWTKTTSSVPVSTSNSFSILDVPGDFTLTVSVTDSHGQSTTKTFTVSIPVPPLGVVVKTASGTIVSNDSTMSTSETLTVYASGGIGSYVYQWTLGDVINTDSFIVVTNNGNLSLTVTSGTSTATWNATINIPAPPAALTLSVTDNNNASVIAGSTITAATTLNISVAGGTAPYTPLWNGSYTMPISYENNGSLVLRVMDSSTPIKIASFGLTVDISNPVILKAYMGDVLVLSGTIITLQTMILLVASGGTGSYTYNVNGNVGNNLLLLSAGNSGLFTIFATDSLGNSSDEILITNAVPEPLVFTIASSSGQVQNGSVITANSILVPTISGGTKPYTYSWTTADSIPIAIANNGPMTLTVSDAAGQTKSISIYVNIPLTLSITRTGSSVITLTANTNGVGYLWSTGETTRSIVVSPRITTLYSVVVMGTSAEILIEILPNILVNNVIATARSNIANNDIISISGTTVSTVANVDNITFNFPIYTGNIVVVNRGTNYVIAESNNVQQRIEIPALPSTVSVFGTSFKFIEKLKLKIADNLSHPYYESGGIKIQINGGYGTVRVYADDDGAWRDIFEHTNSSGTYIKRGEVKNSYKFIAIDELGQRSKLRFEIVRNNDNVSGMPLIFAILIAIFGLLFFRK